MLSVKPGFSTQQSNPNVEVTALRFTTLTTVCSHFTTNANKIAQKSKVIF